MARVMARFLVALLLAGCASPVVGPGDSGIPVRSAQPRPEDRLERQAHDALERWAAAVRANGGASITFEGALTSQIGSWEDAEGENNKLALEAGLVETVTAIPDERPGRREVKWVDGSKVDVDVLSARQALDALIAAGTVECAACEPLRVTDANLATGLVETSEGPAEVPMWVYAVRGSAVRITRVAVDESVSVDPPPWDADDPPEGLSINLAMGEAGSKQLDVQFVGAPEDCDVEYDVEAVESELAVVVLVTPDGESECADLLGQLRTANVTLDAKLGERAVLEVRQGLPVPVLAP